MSLVLLLVSEALGVRERRAGVLIVALRAEIARLEAQLESLGANAPPLPLAAAGLSPRIPTLNAS